MAGRIVGVEALDEPLEEIAHEAGYYFAHGGPAVRDLFLGDLTHAVERIMESPLSFPHWPRRPGVRRVLLSQFPFSIGFVAGGDEPPLVVVVAHGRRRPSYWLRRLAKAKAQR